MLIQLLELGEHLMEHLVGLLAHIVYLHLQIGVFPMQIDDVSHHFRVNALFAFSHDLVPRFGVIGADFA